MIVSILTDTLFWTVSQNTAYAVTPAVYGIIMFLTAGVFIYWSNRQLSKQIKN